MTMLDVEKYIRTETKFSAAGSIAVTVVFYILAFDLFEPVAVPGAGGYAFDFLPQSFMTALICTWLPGIVTRKRMKSGSLALSDLAPRQSLLKSGLLYALLCLLLGGVAAASAVYYSGIETVDWALGLAVKIVFAGAIAMIVTPAGLRRLLRTAS